MSDLAVKLAAEALATHRWKSMGIASAECECGAVLYGDADPFPADDAFRRHLAESILAAAAPALAAAERERCIKLARDKRATYYAGPADLGNVTRSALSRDFADLLAAAPDTTTTGKETR